MFRAAAVAILSAGILAAPAQARIEKQAWGETPDHQKVDLYTLSNAGGMSVSLSTRGAAIQSLKVPDRDGRMADIVRGFDSLAGYLVPDNSHIGAVIGRYADEIKGAKFTLAGVTYHLNANTPGGNTLHGGLAGFDKKVWQAEAHDGASPSLTFRYTSPDGEEHFPGTLQVAVTYTLQADNALRLDYRATTDRLTVLNLTNHSYFNLRGHDQGGIGEARLTVMADRVNLADRDHLVSGASEPVRGTAFDFTTPTPIVRHINDWWDPQMTSGPGYDQNFILRGRPGTLRLAARVEEPQSGRVMEVLTTQQTLQLYTANNAVPLAGKGGALYVQHGAYCLETQHYADAPNHPEFPTTELKPGENFHEVTVFRFPRPK